MLRQDTSGVEGGDILGVGGTQEGETERDAVRNLLHGVRAGRGGALFVVGEAGLGKTTVLAQARELAGSEIRIGWGCGDVMETSLPFGLLAAALDTLGVPRNLLDLLGAGSQSSEIQAARFSGVLRWLEVTATAPVLLTLDDLHWADANSLALVSFLTRRTRRLPVAVLAALRPWPSAAYELSAVLAYDGHASVARLEPLSRDAGAALLAARLGGPVSGTVLNTALDLCGGNPLLLEQVAAAIRRGEDVGSPNRIGNSVIRTKIVLTRFAGVPPIAIRCAQAASVLGTQFRPELAAAVARLSDAEADIALDALCRSGLVHSETETTAEFVHPLFRQALYDDLAIPVRTRLHARAFTVLTAQGLHGEAIEHAICADLTGDDIAITAMTRAGMAALRSGAPALATRQLQTAVRAAGSRAGADLLLALAESLIMAGRPGESIPVCDRLRAEQELTSAQQVQLLRTLGRAFSVIGAHHNSMICFTQATEFAEAHGPAVTTEVLSDAALATWISAGPARSLPLAERACTLATNTKQPLSNRAVSVWGYLTYLSGDPQGLFASEATSSAVETAALASLSHLYWSWDALRIFSIAATFAERFNDAQRVLDMLVTVTERINTAETRIGLAVTQAIVAARQGRLSEALGFVELASSSANLLPVYVSHAGSVQAEVLYQMGRSAESAEWCDRIEPEVTARGESYTLLRLWNVRGQHLLRSGRPEAASELYVKLEELSRMMGIGEPCCIPWARHAITAHLSACRTPDARRVIAQLDRSAARLSCRYPRIAAEAGRASLAEAAGDHAAAEAHFSSALTLHQQVSLPLEQVETLLGYGAFLRRRGHLCRARPLLARAAEIADASQADGLAEQVHEELMVAGGRRRRSRSREDAAKLTVQEQRVARLAAAGHSNREIAAKLILSVKTIEYHLQQIYTKLGISSRRQLMTGHHCGDKVAGH